MAYEVNDIPICRLNRVESIRNNVSQIETLALDITDHNNYK